MSKYEPLRRYLETRAGEQTPMTFAEVERILECPLPPSARTRSGWWSNNPGTHVGVGAWRNAGWKTSRVDVGGEKLIFVRDRRESAAGGRRPNPSNPQLDSIAVALDQLSAAGRRLIGDYVSEADGDASAALARAVHEAAIARRGRLIDRIRASAPRVPPGEKDSVELIREDRDAR